MIKSSKYLLVFAGLFLLLGIGLFITSQKFLPILLQHTVHYCQTALSSFSMQVPGGIGIFLISLLLLLIGYAIAKLMILYVKLVSFRGKLHAQTQQNVAFDRLVSELGLSGKAFLVESSKPYAFCHGIRSPHIYISTALFEMMNTSELEVVLRHEKYHLEHKDPFVMLLAEIAKSLFPFFPLLSDLVQNYRIEREIKADRQATDELGNPQSLISVLKKLLSCEPTEQYALAPALADHETLEMRIKALVNKDYYFMRFNLLNVFISVLMVGVFMLLVIAPVRAIEIHGEDYDVMMVCLHRGACASWCRDNKTVTPYSKAPNASYPYTPVNQTLSL